MFSLCVAWNLCVAGKYSLEDCTKTRPIVSLFCLSARFVLEIEFLGFVMGGIVCCNRKLGMCVFLMLDLFGYVDSRCSL